MIASLFFIAKTVAVFEGGNETLWLIAIVLHCHMAERIKPKLVLLLCHLADAYAGSAQSSVSRLRC